MIMFFNIQKSFVFFKNHTENLDLIDTETDGYEEKNLSEMGNSQLPDSGEESAPASNTQEISFKAGIKGIRLEPHFLDQIETEYSQRVHQRDLFWMNYELANKKTATINRQKTG